MPKSKDRNEEEMIQRAQRELETTSDPIEKLRLQCLARGSSGIIGFGKVFRRMDDDGSRALNMEEFQKGIHDSGMTGMSDDELKEMFDAFDKDKSGSIVFDEFLTTIRPPMNEARRRVIMEAFTKMDNTGDGVVDMNDLRKVYSVRQHPKYQSGEMTEEEILRDFLKNFELNGVVDGKVTKDEFMDYYSGVSASIDHDGYFDLMMRNSYKL